MNTTLQCTARPKVLGAMLTLSTVVTLAPAASADDGLPTAEQASHPEVDVDVEDDFTSPRANPDAAADRRQAVKDGERSAQAPATARYRQITVDLDGRPGAAAVTWPAGDTETTVPHVQVQVRDRDGQWSPWQDLAVDAQAKDRVQGSDVVTYGAQATTARFRVQDVVGEPEVQTFDSPVTTKDQQASQEATEQAATGEAAAWQQASKATTSGAPQQSTTTASTYPVNGPIISRRADWGADEATTTWTPRKMPSFKGTDIHHTASPNEYTPAEVPAILRSIHQYHAVTRDWGDIGYNVIIDRYGRAWQGRANNLEDVPVGAHAAGLNSVSYGVSMLGNFQDVLPTDAQRGAAASVAGWALSSHGVDPNSTYSITSSYIKGGGGTFNAVTAHREVAYTLCPGDAFYGTFPAFRQSVAAFAGKGQTAVQKVAATTASSSVTVPQVSAHVRDAYPRSTAATDTVYLSHWSDRSRAAVTAVQAQHGGHPSMVTSSGWVPREVLDDLQRLGTSRVVITSPQDEVTQQALDQLRAYGITVERAAGSTVQEAATLAAGQWAGQTGGTVYVTSPGQADLVTAGAAAIHDDAPVLVTGSGGLDEAALQVLRDLAPSRVRIVGGPDSVPETVEGQIAGVAGTSQVQRISGSNRAETSANLATAVWGPGGANGAVLLHGYDANPSAPTALNVAAAKDNPVFYTGAACQSAPVARAMQAVGSTVNTLAGDPARTEFSAGTATCG